MEAEWFPFNLPVIIYKPGLVGQQTPAKRTALDKPVQKSYKEVIGWLA